MNSSVTMKRGNPDAVAVVGGDVENLILLSVGMLLIATGQLLMHRNYLFAIATMVVGTFDVIASMVMGIIIIITRWP